MHTSTTKAGINSMAMETVVKWTCDRQGPECQHVAASTELFGFAGRGYRMDLCAHELAEFHRLMEPWALAAKKLGVMQKLLGENERTLIPGEVLVPEPVPQRDVMWWTNPDGADKGTQNVYKALRKKIWAWGKEYPWRFPNLKGNLGAIPQNVGYAWTNEVHFGDRAPVGSEPPETCPPEPVPPEEAVPEVPPAVEAEADVVPPSPYGRAVRRARGNVAASLFQPFAASGVADA
jgi:hypothetical protein